MNALTEAKYLRAAELLNEEVAKRVVSLMAPGAKCDPLSAENFEQAINDKLGFGDDATFVTTLTASLRAGLSVNKLLNDLTTAYWRKQAEIEAEADVLAEIEYERQHP